jgi:hypothetical protein
MHVVLLGKPFGSPEKNVLMLESLRSVKVGLVQDLGHRKEGRKTLPSSRKVPKVLNLWSLLTRKGRLMSSIA